MRFSNRIAPAIAVAALLVFAASATSQSEPQNSVHTVGASASGASTSPTAPQNPPDNSGSVTPAAAPAPPAAQDRQPSATAPAAATTPPQNQQPPAPVSPAAPAATPQSGTEDSPKRIGGIVPNFITTNQSESTAAPMTVKQKYDLAYHQFFDVSAHVGNAFQAALQQASNGQPHYGQGWGAYAERFGAAEGDQVTSSLLIYGFLPSVLHDDPRYFRRGKGSFMSRVLYAASRTVITRKDTGESTFNIPQVLGQLGQGAISTAYYPQQDRSAGAVFHNWGINLAYTSAYLTLREFYPDAMRIVFHRKPKDNNDN